VNQIVNGNNTICVNKSPKALEKGIDSIFEFNTYKASPGWESIQNAFILTIDKTQKFNMGVNHRGQGDVSPQNLQGGPKT